MDEQQLENSNVPKQLQPHIYKKGQSGNPNGRPKGSISLKQYAKKMIQQMTPEEREDFLEGMDKRFIWEMAEGKADTKSDITSAGEKIVFLPPEVISKLNGTTPETKGVHRE